MRSHFCLYSSELLAQVVTTVNAGFGLAPVAPSGSVKLISTVPIQIAGCILMIPFSPNAREVVAALPFGGELRERALERGGLRGVLN